MRLLVTALSLCALTARAATDGPAASPEFFETKIRPVLAKQCYGCHAASKMGGLDLTARVGLEKGGARGSALGESGWLMRAITYTDDQLKMPPAGKLSDAEIADLTAWVKAGAHWPEHKAAVQAAGPGYKITRRAAGLVGLPARAEARAACRQTVGVATDEY